MINKTTRTIRKRTDAVNVSDMSGGRTLCNMMNEARQLVVELSELAIEAENEGDSDLADELMEEAAIYEANYLDYKKIHEGWRQTIKTMNNETKRANENEIKLLQERASHNATKREVRKLIRQQTVKYRR